jgi:hypothetical protein
MRVRKYEATRDRESVKRIWREVGWLQEGVEQEQAMDAYIEAGYALVGEVEGFAESLVLAVPGALHYLGDDLPMCALTGVATSPIVRGQGMASSLAAACLASEAASGAVVAALFMFDQGYYDRLGFGSGSYDHLVKFHPAWLTVEDSPRAAERVTRDDWEEVHCARLGRQRHHGGVNLIPPAITRAEMIWTKRPLGLGYRDGPGGTLSHFIWCAAENMEYGPCRVRWMVYRNRKEFLELMALIKSLSDQMGLVSIVEPPGIQLQDLLDRPFMHRRISQGSSFSAGIHAYAPWQVRIRDLQGCLQYTHVSGGPIRFNLVLEDPIEGYVGPDALWRGVAGEYVVTLDSSSYSEPGTEPNLPTMHASVNAFTRFWLGVRCAIGLSYTDVLDAPRALLAQLDTALRLPDPKPDWEF